MRPERGENGRHADGFGDVGLVRVCVEGNVNRMSNYFRETRSERVATVVDDPYKRPPRRVNERSSCLFLLLAFASCLDKIHAPLV